MEHQFQVQGMTCGHCERAVTNAVRDLDSEATVKVDLPTGQVTVQSALTREVLTHAITEEGFVVAA